MKDDHRVMLGLIILAVVCAVVLFVFAQTAGGGFAGRVWRADPSRTAERHQNAWAGSPARFPEDPNSSE